MNTLTALFLAKSWIEKGGGGGYSIKTLPDVDLVITAKSDSFTFSTFGGTSRTFNLTSTTSVIELADGVTLQLELKLNVTGAYADRVGSLTGDYSIELRLVHTKYNLPITTISFDTSSINLKSSVGSVSYDITKTPHYESSNLITPLSTFPLQGKQVSVSDTFSKSGSATGAPQFVATIPAQTVHITNIKWC